MVLLKKTARLLILFILTNVFQILPPIKVYVKVLPNLSGKKLCFQYITSALVGGDGVGRMAQELKC